MKKQGVALSGAIGFVGAVVSSLLGFVLYAVVGRGLGTELTGAFFEVVGWFLIVTTLLRLGADTGLLRSWSIQSGAQSGDPGALRETLWIALAPVLVVSVLAGVVLNLLAPTLAGHLADLDRDSATLLLRALGGALPAAVVAAVLLAGLRGLGSVVAFTVLQNIVVPVLRVALAATVVALGVGGVGGVIAAWALPLPLVLVVAGGLTFRALRPSALPASVSVSSSTPPTTDRRGRRRQFWSFSLARGVAASLEMLLDWLDVLVVASLRSLHEAGIYAVVTRVVRAGLVVDTAVRLAVAPRVAAMLADDDREGTSTLFTLMARVVILLAWPAYLLLMVFGPTVLSGFGSGFTSGAKVLAVLSASMMVVMAAGIVQSLLLMGGRSHYQLGNKIVAVLVNLGLNLALVPGFGIMGAAVAWTLTLAIDTSLAAWQVRHRLGVRLRPEALVLPAVLTLGMIGGGALLARWTVGQNWWGLAAALVIAGGAYAAVVFKLRRRLGLAELLSL